MDPRLLKHYDNELRHIRELGGEFAREFPKIAGRLGLDAFECADPYVERLLEGFAFLAARVQLKMDSEFPQLVQNLLEVIYPHFLAPMPSMAIVQFEPDASKSGLSEGYSIPRGTVLRGKLVKGEQTACEYRTAHDLQLWPLEVVQADYFSRDVAAIELPTDVRATTAAGLRVRLRIAPGHKFNKLALENLPVYILGREELPVTLFEQCMAHADWVLVKPVGQGETWHELFGNDTIQPLGFEPQHALLPYQLASFQGYRLLSEYFAFRERYLFFELRGIGPAFRRCTGSEVDVTILFNRAEAGFTHAVDKSNVVLFCTPAINLFPKRTDPVHVDNRKSEHHIVPDRTRPLDLEIYQVSRVIGLGSGAENKQEFYPFYSLTDQTAEESRGYYAIRRTPRLVSRKQQKFGTRTSYLGSEVYVSLVDRRNSPYSSDLQVLAVETLCTNRDLPLQLPLGTGTTDFALEIAAPVNSVRCITGPTPPRPSVAHAPGEMIWKLVSHLGLNYLSLTGEGTDEGAGALREMLRLYADSGEATMQHQIDGVRSIRSEPIIRQLSTTGPLAFGRGLEVTVTLDEESFEGIGVYLLGAVLEQFFSKYVSINSFTETVLRTVQRQEVMRWPTRIGRRHIL
jgi:type VI secretion system protein ImpG